MRRVSRSQRMVYYDNRARAAVSTSNGRPATHSSGRRGAAQANNRNGRQRSISPPPRQERYDANLGLLAPKFFADYNAINNEFIELDWLEHEATAFSAVDNRTVTVPTAGRQSQRNYLS